MSSTVGKSLTEQAHEAVLAEVKTTSANAVVLDVNLAEAEASINTTKAKWSFTAYVKKVFKGAFTTGVRIERPLSLLSLIRKNDESES
jgi:hypothetical protein